MDLTHDGITQPVEEWALDYGIPADLIRNRIRSGWPAERAITEPMPTEPPVEVLRFFDSGRATNPRADLWRGVIQQAFEDAGSGAKHLAAERQEAREWLTTPSEDFDEVCELAGVEPDQVRAHALLIIGSSSADGSASKKRPYNKTPRLKNEKSREDVIAFNGEALTIREWAERLGISKNTLYSRLRSPLWTLERALTEERGQSGGFRNQAMLAKAERITHNGKTRTIREWAESAGLAPNVFRKRLDLGWSMERALGRKPKSGCASILEHNGECLTTSEWAKRLGMSKNALQVRLSRPGWTLARALTTPGRSWKKSEPALEVSQH